MGLRRSCAHPTTVHDVKELHGELSLSDPFVALWPQPSQLNPLLATSFLSSAIQEELFNRAQFPSADCILHLPTYTSCSHSGRGTRHVNSCYFDNFVQLKHPQEGRIRFSYPVTYHPISHHILGPCTSGAKRLNQKLLDRVEKRSFGHLSSIGHVREILPHNSTIGPP